MQNRFSERQDFRFLVLITRGPSNEGGLEELVELLDREAICSDRLSTCCSRTVILALISRSVLTTVSLPAS